MGNPTAAEKAAAAAANTNAEGAGGASGADAVGVAAAAKPAAATKAKATTEPDAAPRRVVPLQVTRWQLGEFMNHRHSVAPASNTPFEDLLRPEFWANITRLTAGDIIEVRPEDQSYYAELYVMKKDRNSATVAVIRAPVRLEAAFKPLPGEKSFKIEFAGTHAKWRVIRLADLAVMRDKFASEAEARAWLGEYERVVAA
jgi:hypothetical protein